MAAPRPGMPEQEGAGKNADWLPIEPTAVWRLSRRPGGGAPRHRLRRHSCRLGKQEMLECERFRGPQNALSFVHGGCGTNNRVRRAPAYREKPRTAPYHHIAPHQSYSKVVNTHLYSEYHQSNKKRGSRYVVTLNTNFPYLYRT